MRTLYNLTTIIASYLIRYGTLLVILFSISACSTVDLGDDGTAIFYEEQPVAVPHLLDLPALPQEEEAIQQRIDGGYDALWSEPISVRLQVESLSPERIDFVPLYTIEIVVINKDDIVTSYAGRVTTVEWERILINANGCSGFWNNSGTGWSASSAAENEHLVFGLFHNLQMTSSPYGYFGAGTGLSFQSSAIGYEVTLQGLAEVYEVGQYTEHKSKKTFIKSTRVWVNAKSGLVMRTVNSEMKVIWEQDHTIAVEPPLSC